MAVAGKGNSSQYSPWVRRGLTIGGLLLAAYLLLFGNLEPTRPLVSRTAAVAVLMATLWITEVIPLAVTSLLPLALMPLLGIQSGEDVAGQYISSTIFLYIGGFLVALAMQKWDLHRRIALRMMKLVGSTPRRLILGFMLASATLSMFISNTATAMMMVTIAMAIISTVEGPQDTASRRSPFAIGLLLAVAYSASIGGVATLVGTPTNLSFVRIYQIHFPDLNQISFVNWMFFALPVAAILLIVAWLTIVWFWCPRDAKALAESELNQQYRALGAWTWSQKAIMGVFLLLVVLWTTRSNVDLGGLKLYGWASLFEHAKYFDDGVVAVAVSLLLFIIPSYRESGERIIDESVILQVPWNIVLLFGGGFALASAFKESGLSMWVGQQLSGLADVHPIVLVAILCTLLSLLTELTSNVATVEMILPILASLSVTLQIDPWMLMVPATITCSFAFMLPVGTPPNAIVFGTNQLCVADMVKTGFMVNMLGVVLIVLFTWFWGPWCFSN